jgi:ferredoxin
VDLKVMVDAEVCQGHTLCNMVAPDVFHLRDEDGHAYVEPSEIPAELEAVVRRASLNCPEFAIRVVEDDSR